MILYRTTARRIRSEIFTYFPFRLLSGRNKIIIQTGIWHNQLSMNNRKICRSQKSVSDTCWGFIQLCVGILFLWWDNHNFHWSSETTDNCENTIYYSLYLTSNVIYNWIVSHPIQINTQMCSKTLMQATSVRLFYIDLNSALTMKWKYDTEFPSNHYEYKMLDTLY